MHTRTLSAANVIEALRGVAYFRRGTWAAYNHDGHCVGQFETAREASAALGGVA